MTEKIEDSVALNRRLVEAIVIDLDKKFGYTGYKVHDTLAAIQRKEGQCDVIDYIKRTYLNG